MQQTNPPRGGRRRAEAATKAAFVMAKPPREAYPARRRNMFRKIMISTLGAFALGLVGFGFGSAEASGPRPTPTNFVEPQHGE